MEDQRRVVHRLSADNAKLIHQVCVCVCVCVCERERERECENESECERVREREGDRGREGKRRMIRERGEREGIKVVV